MKTSRKPKPLNLTEAQARHLPAHGRLLVVEALREQPDGNVTTILQDTNNKRRWYAKHWDYEWNSPCKPGDVVPCRERWCHKMICGRFAYTEDGELDPTCFYYEADGIEVLKDYGDGGTEYRKDGTAASPWCHPSRMPEEAIRLRPVVEAVECRRVNSIADEAAKSAGVCVLPLQSEDDPSAWYETSPGRCQARTPVGSFKLNWHRRYSRRGPAYAFDAAWGWFYILVLKGAP